MNDFEIDGLPAGDPLTLFTGDRQTVKFRLLDNNGDPVPYGTGTVTVRMASGTVALGGDIPCGAPYGTSAPYGQVDIETAQTVRAGLYRMTVTQFGAGNASQQTFGPRPVQVLNR
jgi:hypothetical protein